MKTKVSILSLLVLSMLFISCDSNKSKVADVAKQFVQAAINDDKATIYELYPEIRFLDNLQITNDLTDKNISVEFNEIDSTYIVNINERMKLVIEVSDSNTIKIIDSYNVFILDSLSNELAVKTGTPISQFSDLTNGSLLCDYSGYDFLNFNLIPYMDFLKEKHYYGLEDNALEGNLYDHDTYIIWGGRDRHVYFEIPVTNRGERLVKGEDYSVEIIYQTKDTNERIGTSVENGVDLAPNETYVFKPYKNDLFRYAEKRNVNWTVYFRFKLSPIEMLVKYAHFSGDEYSEYKDWCKEHIIDEKFVKSLPEAAQIYFQNLFLNKNGTKNNRQTH